MEMEFWPVMIEAANRAGVPLVLANSQLPARSLDRAFRQARWLGHPAERAAAVFAKSEMMAERFRGIGVARVSKSWAKRASIWNCRPLNWRRAGP